MGFNEKTHAFIAARFYARLTDNFGDRGKEAFRHAVRRYAEGRGRRMAQRAIRDGCPLTYETYMRYGEWQSTDEVKALGQENKSELTSLAPDCIIKITRCPWHEQFREMGMDNDAGHEYCRDLDSSLARGFNPEIVYEVTQTLHRSDCCIHIIRSANLRSDGDYSKIQKYLRGFDYHCAHSYWAFARAVNGIFLSEGAAVISGVMEDFRTEYGAEMADVIARHAHTNFDDAD